jgi:hypothetical protein
MIFPVALNAKSVEFRVKPANALENGQVARFAQPFADHFRLHSHELLHYQAKVKSNLSLFLYFECPSGISGIAR